jgi:hypothetical protein
MKLSPKSITLWASATAGLIRLALVERAYTSTNHRVLLAQFTGILSTEDIEGFDKALAAFVSRHGFARDF